MSTARITYEAGRWRWRCGDRHGPLPVTDEFTDPAVVLRSLPDTVWAFAHGEVTIQLTPERVLAWRRRWREGGAVLIVFAALFLVLILMFGLTADTGMLFVARAEAQNSADAAALAGAVSLLHVDEDDPAPALAEAVVMADTFAALNPICGGLPTTTVNLVDHRTIHVRVERTCPTLIMGIAGRPTFRAGAAASARAFPDEGHVRLVQ